ncbi:lysophospholipid acyltransferase 7-like [Centruroides sculpturatus]|uniref:lysophospholipid acyltransferase 7-like n=1 Tax=Centruroides sculpturatus TaxID=218467 RepID=UPI000C6D3B1B|nr:lysophospholipid acyltransferase 7-like [Centruroides sculpturatus]XP_023239383.1 lysophospholipid acyltransferase 7-like [Centruroides sculpturatus]XP_023239385.1 lysophospholipid acyltransferase 7-like [Centruroides sculpturatus]
MIADDIIYVLLLILSIAVGSFIRSIANVKRQQLISTLFGFVLVFFVSGKHIIHPVITILLNSVIVLYCNKQYCHVFSFVCCFLYLAFFRTAEYFGLTTPPAHTNAIQMILTLKMVGIAFELNHSHKINQNATKGISLKHQYEMINPSFIDIIHYSFCHAGVLIGPYYKYKTYHDAFHTSYISEVPCGKFLKQRLWPVPIYFCLFLLFHYLFPLEYATSDDINLRSVWYRIFYMTPIFINFRMRIYIGFILGECVCIMFGIGAYPTISEPQPGKGPTNYAALKQFEDDFDKTSKQEFSFETVHNINEYGSEFSPTIRGGIRSWNRTVQYWLVMFVYKHIPCSKPIRMIVTMLVSSFWHGVHAGYYLCLLSAPFFLLAESQMEKAFRFGSYKFQTMLFDFLWWIFKMQAFAYMGMAFLLLRVDAIFGYWKSIYFVGHVLIIIFYLLGYFVNIYVKRPKNLEKKN